MATEVQILPKNHFYHTMPSDSEESDFDNDDFGDDFETDSGLEVTPMKKCKIRGALLPGLWMNEGHPLVSFDNYQSLSPECVCESVCNSLCGRLLAKKPLCDSPSFKFRSNSDCATIFGDTTPRIPTHVRFSETVLRHEYDPPVYEDDVFDFNRTLFDKLKAKANCKQEDLTDSESDIESDTDSGL